MDSKDLRNNLLGIEEETPFMEADSITEEEERIRKKVARMRLFWFLIGAILIISAFISWEIVDIYKAMK